jgi:hypothetical protein
MNRRLDPYAGWKVVPLSEVLDPAGTRSSVG